MFARFSLTDPRHSQVLEYISVTLLIAMQIGIWATRAEHLRANGLFENYDVFFDADPNQYAARISSIWPHTFIHPGYGLLIGLPVRTLDWLLSASGWVHEGSIRHAAPVVVPAMMGGVATFFHWLTLRNLGIGRTHRLAFTLLMGLGFSQQIFSVVPESYGASGLLITFAIWHLSTLRCDQPECLRAFDLTLIFVLCALASMITITTGFILAICYVCSLAHGQPWIVLATRMFKLFTVILLTVLTSHHIMRTILSMNVQQGHLSLLYDVQSFHQNYNQERLVDITFNVLMIPINLINAIIPATLKVVQGKDATVQLTLISTPQAIPLLSAVLLWVILLRLCWQERTGWPPREQVILTWAVWVIALNVGLHCYFGTEFFLYSQHWYSTLMIILAMVTGRKVSGKIALSAGVGIGLINSVILSRMDELLRL